MSSGVMSRELSGQGFGPSLPIHWFGNVSYKKSSTIKPQWRCAPSCISGQDIHTVYLRWWILFIYRARLYAHPVLSLISKCIFSVTSLSFSKILNFLNRILMIKRYALIKKSQKSNYIKRKLRRQKSFTDILIRDNES